MSEPLKLIEPPSSRSNGLELRAGEMKKVGDIRLLSSVLLDRLQFFRQAGISFDGARDLYQVLGYDRVLTYRKFRARYQRGGIAKRLVDAYPKATWRGGVELMENEEIGEAPTEFEAAFKTLEKKFKLWSMCQRVDILAGMSTYAVLLIGAPGDLSEELPRGNGPDGLLYFTPFSGGGGPGGDRLSRPMAMDADCSILTFQTDTEDPRFGQPLLYQLKRTNLSAPLLTRPVHWSRVIHIAEGLLNDEVYGSPRLEAVWNLLDDLDKVTGGGAEAFWLRANQGLHWDIDKDMQLPAAADQKEALRKQAEDYSNQITRVIRTRGVNIKPLGSEVANFSPQADAILTQIAGTIGIPKRILMGSEMGQLASGQDADNWNTQVMDRRTSYAGPNIVHQLADRLIEYGYLPTPKEYHVEWPKIEDMTEDEKAALAGKLANVNKLYGSTVFTDDEIRKICYKMEPATDTETDQFRAELAVKMATVNKTQGVTIFTPAEIRNLTYGWSPLSPDEAVPVGAPEKIQVTKPPAIAGTPGAVQQDEASVIVKPVPKQDSTGSQAAEGVTPVAASWFAEKLRSLRRKLGQRFASEHSFSTVQVNLPFEEAQKLYIFARDIPDIEIDVEAGGRESLPHITVKYGLHTNAPGDVQRVIDGFGPVTFTLGLTDCFETPDYDCLFVRVDSDDLVRLNARLSSQLEVTDTYPVYQPHATIAYLQKGLGAKYKDITTFVGKRITCDTVWFNNQDDQGTTLSLDKGVLETETELMQVLSAAIQANNTVVIDKILGTKHE